MNKPQAQTSPSHLGFVGRSLCTKYDPSGTPISPANIAIMPNTYDTLKNYNLFIVAAHITRYG